jgi:hypothetical protein
VKQVSGAVREGGRYRPDRGTAMLAGGSSRALAWNSAWALVRPRALFALTDARALSGARTVASLLCI